MSLKPVPSTAPVGFYQHLLSSSIALHGKEVFGKATNPETVTRHLSVRSVGITGC